MAASLQRRQLKGGCPPDYSWYACPGRGSFLGCCASDPCSGGGPGSCSDMAAASLGDLTYGSFADQDCPSGGLFYTCTSPSFMGCCASNPCGSGCPQSDLRPAGLQGGRNDFAPGASASPTPSAAASTTTSSASSNSLTSSSAPSSTTSTPISSATIAPSAAAAATGTPTAGATPSTPNAAAIGGATGGAVALIAILGLLIFLYRRHTLASRRHQQFSMAAAASGHAPPEALHPPHGPNEKTEWLPWRKSPGWSSSHKGSPNPPPWSSPAMSQGSYQYSPQLPQYTVQHPHGPGTSPHAGWGVPTPPPPAAPWSGGAGQQTAHPTAELTGGSPTDMNYRELDGSEVRPRR